MTMSLLGLAAALVHAEHDINHRMRAGMEKSCKKLQTSAKTAIGTYRFGWPQLAASTLEKKSANTPLLETGELQGSIEYQIAGGGMHIEGNVGTNDYKAAWQEFGTSRGIPPRPFMGGALNECEGEIKEIFAKEAMAAFKLAGP